MCGMIPLVEAAPHSRRVRQLLPACCGVLTAITVDLRSGSPLQRVKSGLIEGGVMSAISVIAPWIVPSLIGEPSTNGDTLGSYIFNGIVYGGIGAVFGYVLPEGVKRDWDALAKDLPDRISVLRTAIAQNFHDIH